MTNKLDKMFSVVRVCRQDLMSYGLSKKDALALTDDQMDKIASDISDGLCGTGNFGDCVGYVIDSIERDKAKNKINN